MEVNILIDMFLILILSIIVLPRSPKLYFIIIAVSMAQFMVEIPARHDSTQQARFIWQPEQDDQTPRSEVYPEQHRLPTPASNPIQLILRAPDAFSIVSQALGDSGFSVTGTQDLDAQPTDSQGIPATATLTESGSRRITLEWQSVLADGIRDPYAMWLAIRVFWLAAAFMLFLQRPILGGAAACANLIPVPFLVNAIPYTYFQLNENASVQSANVALQQPESLKDWITEFLSSNGMGVLILGLTVLAGVAFFQWRRLAKADTTIRKIETLLDPALYWIRLNGGLYEFVVQGSEIVVHDLRFDLNKIIPDPLEDDTWRLGPATAVQFVSKNEVHSTQDGRPAPSYSYKRKH
jgi:hypothetical protein